MATMKSLQDIGAVQLAIQICNLPAIKKELVAVPDSDTRTLNETGYKTHVQFRNHKYEILQKEAAKAAEELYLPSDLKEKTLRYVVPIGIRILNWVEYHQKTFNLSVTDIFRLLNVSHFLPCGLIDENKISEDILKDENLDLMIRFKIACFYCKIDHIISLHKQMPPEVWKNFYAENENEARCVDLLKFWSYYLENEIDKLRGSKDINIYGLEIAINTGSRLSVEYFWNNLSTETKREIAISTAIDAASTENRNYFVHLVYSPESFKDIFFFLFFNMEQQMKVEFFRKYFSQRRYWTVLTWFFDWPYQDHFMKTIRLIWDIIPKEIYADLLVEISKIIRCKSKSPLIYRDEDTYDFERVLKEFWSESPDRFKRAVFAGVDKLYHPLMCVEFAGSNNDVGDVLLNLFSSENCTERFEIIDVIISSATNEEKEDFIVSCRGESICARLAKSQQWETLEKIVMKCLSGEEDKIRRFKKDFKLSQGESVCSDFVENEDYDAVEFFMKWGVLDEEDLIELKQKIAFSFCVKCTLVDLILFKGKVEVVDRFLKLFLSSEERISDFKNKLKFNRDLECKLAQLARNGKFECIEVFVEWACMSSEEFATVKEIMANKFGGKICESIILRCKWDTLEEFVSWCFQSQKDIEEFKRKTLYLENGSRIHRSLIAEDKRIEAKIFCEWLGLSAKEITQLEYETARLDYETDSYSFPSTSGIGNVMVF